MDGRSCGFFERIMDGEGYHPCHEIKAAMRMSGATPQRSTIAGVYEGVNWNGNPRQGDRRRYELESSGNRNRAAIVPSCNHRACTTGNQRQRGGVDDVKPT